MVELSHPQELVMLFPLALAAMLCCSSQIPTSQAGIAAWTCRDQVALGSVQLAELEAPALRVMELLRDGDEQALWDAAHPDFRGYTRRAEFSQNYESFTVWTAAGWPPRLVELYFLDKSGVVTQGVRCQSATVPEVDGAVLYTSPKHRKEVVAFYRLGGEPIGWTATLRLWPEGDSWQFSQVLFTAHAYKGRDAEGWLTASQELETNGEVLAAMYARLAAKVLADRGESIETGQERAMMEQIRAWQANEATQAYLGQWATPEGSFTILQVNLETSPTELVPQVVYITPGPQDTASVRAEGERILAWVLAENPGFADLFDGMLFTAYTEPPADPNKLYRHVSVPVKVPSPSAEESAP